VFLVVVVLGVWTGLSLIAGPVISTGVQAPAARNQFPSKE